ncbi:MAG: AAA family ATPase [Candidatus Aegiribacteria sp.]|nr:AAA family ATPase [Candidatus Aegiribacteria sp.]
MIPFRGAMVGREHQLSRAVNFILDLSIEESNGILFLWAPPGIGKTRLVIEVERSLPQRDFIFIEGDDAAGSAPFFDLLENWFNLNTGATLEDNFEAFSSIWEGLLLNLSIGRPREFRDKRMELEKARPYFEYLLGLNFDEESIAFRLEPAQRAEKVSHALMTFFDVLALLDPLVVVLENIQWFSGDDLLTVKRIIESTSGAARAFIITGRPDKAGNKPDFPDTASYVRTDTVILDGLPENSIKSFVEELGTGSPEDRLVELLWERAGGVPLFLEQAIDYLSETGLIDSSGSELLLKVSATEIPLSIRDMFISRMRFLPDSVRKIAMAASVLGSSFRRSDIEAMVETGSVDYGLMIGIEKHIFHLGGSSGSFSHILFRDWISEMSPVTELREFHLKAGRILEKESESYPSPSRLEKISDHYLFGGEDVKAASFMRQAAAAYADNFENRAASRMYRKLIPMLNEPEKTRTELKLSDVYKNGGLLNSGIELLSGTLSRISGLSSIDRHCEALVLLKLGTYLGASGKLVEAEEMLVNCLKVFEDCDDIENQAVAVRHLGLAVRSAGRIAEAVSLGERSIELARRSGDPRLICASLYWSAITYRQTGDYQKMKEYTEEHVELAKRSGIIKSIIMGYDNLMRVHIYNRDYDAAEEVHKKLSSAAEKTANWAALSTATSKLGIIHLRRGEWESAMECFRKCVSLSEKTGNLRAKCAALGNLAHASIAMEDNGSALKYSTELIDTASAIGFQTGLMSGYARMGYIFCLRGDYESALDCIQTQIEHAEFLSDIRNLSNGWEAIADIQFRLNEIPESVASIDRAIVYSLKASDMLQYSNQLALKGRILFLSGRKREAESFLKEALTHTEGRKGQEKLIFRCRLYLLAIKAGIDPESSTEILEMPDEAPDGYCRGEVYYCHWKLTGDSLSASKAVDLLSEFTGSLPHPVLQRMLDDLRE